MKVFEPFSRQPEPSGTALVRSAARSDPPEGSVIAIAAICSPLARPGSQRACCSGVVNEVR